MSLSPRYRPRWAFALLSTFSNRSKITLSTTVGTPPSKIAAHHLQSEDYLFGTKQTSHHTRQIAPGREKAPRMARHPTPSPSRFVLVRFFCVIDKTRHSS